MRKFIDCLLHIGCYALVLVIATRLFPKQIYINLDNYGIWSFVAATIMFILNKTVKPVITWLTLPITALTLGLFYPFVNVLILELISLILGNYFEVHGIILLALISIFISVMNILMDRLFIKPLLRKDR